ncbi:MAG TPA: hypothetical protein VJ201_04665 [Candidatus Babeliales bacterium]|nr:hypothetical protein [Candidatus Babeliales bacterium]HLC07343.1 hypothetical protein [Candidatus Babeliales bacterium]
MIDTIVLTLPPDMYQISKPDKFRPAAHWALLTDQGKEARMHYSAITSKQNATKKELLKGIYKPHLTLAYCRGVQGVVELLLKIELSLPKLLYGNNFNELQYKDFATINHKLVAVLATMGVMVKPENLADVPVLAIHYSKNIPLTDGSTPYHYINKIKEANVRFSLDTNQTDYRNEGHSYKWHCNSYEVVFYDKIKDLEKAKQSSKRAIEKDNELQQGLFKTFEKQHKLEFLRMEVRLNKRAKIKTLFKVLKVSADLTFKKLFKPAIAKKVLLHYISELERNRSPLLNFKAGDDKSFLAQLSFDNPNITPKQAMALLGFKRALEAAPLRELKAIIGKNKPQSWYRLIADTKNITLPAAHNPFKEIRKCIQEFKAIKFNKGKIS